MRKHSDLILSASLALASLALLLCVLGSRAVRTEAATPNGRYQDQIHSPSFDGASRPLVVGLNLEPNLDYLLGPDLTSIAVIEQVMGGLYRYQSDGSIEPAGATTFAVSPDGLVYTVTLRPDALWSDGQAVTAQHYVDGMLHQLDPDTGSGYAFILYTIEGAEDFNTGVITDPGQVGITALSPLELQFTLRDPAAFFPSLMATIATYPARLDIINTDPDWTEPGHFVGNGPYVLTEWTHFVELALEKSLTYYDADQVTIDEVRFLILEPSQQVQAFEDDRLDVADAPWWELPHILSDPVVSAEFHRTPRPGVYYLGMNTQLTPTSNISVRMALASAIDRGGILTDVLNSPWREAATSVIPAGIPGYQNGAVGYTFNPTQAQIYLDQAGYPGGTGFPGIELWANFANEATIDAVAQSWRDNLGISVTTFYTGFQLYSGLLDACRSDPGTCDYNAYRMGWVMDYADAHNILNDVFHPDSPAQHTGWDDARYRQLIGLALTETNQISRTAYFQEADQILVEQDAAIIPLYFYDRQSLVKSDVLFEYVPFGGPHIMDWEIVTVAAATIGTGGGTICSPDGDICIDFPAGALVDTAAVTYTTAYSPSGPAPDGFVFANNAFALEVVDAGTGQEITTFAQPLTVTIDYTDGDLDGQDEGTLELMLWDGGGWSSDAVIVVGRDKVHNRLVARVSHLTQFALFGEIPPSRPIVVGLNEEPNLDLYWYGSIRSHEVGGQLMQSLFQYAPNGSIEPAGAVTYTVSGDRRVCTITLRADARWSDGEAVLAQHYVDGVLRRVAPESEGYYCGALYVLEGAEDYHTGVITDPGQVGVAALGPFELQFSLREPTGHFPSLMATPATYPARLDVIDGDPDWTEPGHFVGNGPYMLLEWVHDHHLTIVKNPNYHGADQVMLEQVTFRILPNLAEQRVAYEDDLLDVSGVPAWELHYILSDPVLSAEFHRTPRPGVYYLGMNTQLTPTNNISVRMALASAIDRGGILTDALNMPWREAATSVIPGGIPGYQNDAVGYTFNPTQAQIYLAQAGFPGGTGFPGVELWANFGNEATIDAVAQSWRDNLGISVTTFYTDFQQYSGLLDACRSDPGTCGYNAYRMGWIMDYADAHNILNDLFHPDSPAQHTGWDDARYRQLIGLALTETNQISRTAYFQEADQILAEQDVAIIPLFFYDNQSLVKSDLLPEYIPFYWGPFYMNWRLVTATSDIITETGGTVGSPDGDVTVEFPDPAVSETVVVTYSAFYLPPHPPTGTFGFAGTGFTLEVTEIASGDEITTFVEPLTITINYTEGDLGGQDENTLELMTWNGSAWVSDGITIIERDTLNNRIVALIEHLTEFALFGQHRLFLPVILRHE